MKRKIIFCIVLFFVGHINITIAQTIPKNDHLNQYNKAVDKKTTKKRKPAPQEDPLTEYYIKRIEQLEKDSIANKEEVENLRALLAARDNSNSALRSEKEITSEILLKTSKDRDNYQLERDTFKARADSLENIIYLRDSMDNIVTRFYFDYLKAYPAYNTRRRETERETDDFDKWQKVVVEFKLSTIGNADVPNGKFKIMVQDEKSGEFLYHEEGDRTNKVSFDYYGGIRIERFSVRNTKHPFEDSRIFIVRLYYEDYPIPIGNQKITLEK